MGSPIFAIPALQELLNSNHEVISVYTREPKPSGRGKKITKTPIHLLAEEHNIPVLTPRTLKRESINNDVDIIIVAAYGMLLPKQILEHPKYGSINIHPSLLPRWRGAAPIQHTILSGDTKTGVCIMKMTTALDAGDILSLEEVDISDSDDYQILHNKLSKIGAKLLIELINNIKNITPKPQNSFGITYANKIKKELVEWNTHAIQIIRKIKALQSINCIIKGKRIKILKANFDHFTHDFLPGDIINDKLHIACKDGIIKPQILQIPGKSAVNVKDFLRANNNLL